MKVSKLFLLLILLVASNANAQQKIYWANNEVGIMSANIDGSDPKTLIQNRILRLVSIDIDTINNKIYWIDSSKKHIGKSNIDGTGVEILLQFTTSVPSVIRVDAKNSKIYWLEKTDKKLYKANLDGTSKEVVASNLPAGYYNFELDIANNKIYWVDETNNKIQRSNFAGDVKEDVIVGTTTEIVNNIKLDFINKRIYWVASQYTDSVKYTLKSKTTEGLDEKVIFSKKYSFTGYYLEYEINPVQNSIYIKDRNESRGGLGFLIGKLDGSNLNATFGWNANFTQYGFRADVKNNKIYAIGVYPHGIYQFSITSTQYLLQYITKETIISPNGIAIDKSAGKMYWTDQLSSKIQRANLDGTNIEDLVKPNIPSVSSPLGMALDLVNKQMYWTDRGTNFVRKANLDGTNIQTVISFTNGSDGNTPTAGALGLTFPDGIALDIPNKKIYFIAQGAVGIYRANFDGTGIEVVNRNIRNFPNQLALDLDNKKIYWSEDRVGIIKANLDGTQRDTFYKKQYIRDGGIALDITNKKLYWIVDSILQKVNLDGTNPVNLISNLPLQLNGFGGYMTWGATHSYVAGEIVSKIKEVKNDLKANVFPTVFNNYLNIELNEPIIEAATYEIYDLNGKVVKNGVLNNEKTTLLANQIQNGFYIIKVTSSDKIFSTKLIKE